MSSPVRVAFSRATSSAGAEESIAGHARAFVLVGDRERDRAASRADVEDPRRREVGDGRERPLDDHLGLRPWDEHPRVDEQRETAEAPLAEDVGERLPLLAADEQRLERLLLIRAKRPATVGVEVGAARPEDVRKEELGVDASRLAPGQGEPVAARSRTSTTDEVASLL